MMTVDLYQQALEQARAGRTEQALASLDALLKLRPDNGAAWNDAGALLYAQGRYADACRYFRRAAESTFAPAQACRNLVQAYAAAGEPSRAMQYFEAVRQEGLLDAALAERIAAGFTAAHEPASAMETLHRARRALPEAKTLDAAIASLRKQRAKIAFFVGGDGSTFLTDILRHTRQRYEVRVFDGKTAEQMHDLMRWSDISWFEWCTNLAQIGTSLPKVCRTIIRLHRYEAYETWPRLIRWENVDALVTVGNDWVLKAMDAAVGDIRAKVPIVRIPNGVNLDVHTFKRRRPGRNIAFVGAIRMVKNPMLLLQCMAALKAIDPGYRLFIAGKVCDLLLNHYLEHAIEQMDLKEMVVYDGFQTDIPGWLADKHYLVSTSVIEGCPMGILEAMAAGIKPVIHNFPGAQRVLGTDWLFDTPQDFCRRICEPGYNSESYRSFVERRYPLCVQLRRIDELFALFEKNPWTEEFAACPAKFAGLSALTV